MANTQLSDATHIMAYVALHPHEQLKSEQIAASLNTDPTMVRRLMSKLRKAGLLESTRGIARPKLACDPAKINLRLIYLAVSSHRDFLTVDRDTSQDCPVGSVMPRVMTNYYQEIQNSAEGRMARITLQDVMNDIENAQ
ncbi:Rrf2 family transcriptional regulator [Lactiplantibacillus sp. WILCCON 0030]|uniref:Rrf2 family transcriptional regulator n=1 Tax=Lactiplantibacillus brownii TaxID=3069269 RepID=A0ABU1AAY0_9LACO|nr:Rrf2 family transcriptional regulator [Lactiplantibacillus brownii]MDQ7937548.1 Rrf2 family transcriptional regulator [Lactiplantibacillus brownii]